jgi:hypothetical protein
MRGKTIMDVPYNEIILDFCGIRSMSIKFAKEYNFSQE